MAGMIATALQNLRLDVPDFDKYMRSFGSYGALDFFADQNEIPNALLTAESRAAAFGSIGRTVQIPVLKNGVITTGSSRDCTMPTAEAESALASVTFTTITAGFQIAQADFVNNEIAYKKALAERMVAASKAIASDIDSLALTALGAAKTQVFASDLGYTITGDSVQVPAAMQTEILGDVEVMLNANDFNDKVNIVGNYGVKQLVQKLAQLGDANAVNKVLEFAGKDFYFTKNISDASGKVGTLYAVNDGSVGIFTRVGKEELLGSSIGDAEEYGTMVLPGLEKLGTVGFHYKKSSTDNGGTADCKTVEQYKFSIDVACVTAYNSDPSTIASPIVKAELATRSGSPIAMPVNNVGN